jgi:hypothetical protein
MPFDLRTKANLCFLYLAGLLCRLTEPDPCKDFLAMIEKRPIELGELTEAEKDFLRQCPRASSSGTAYAPEERIVS